MFRLLFWNLHGKPDALEFAHDLCESRSVDLFIAAEVPTGATTLRRSQMARIGYRVYREELTVEEVTAYEFAAAFRVRSSAGPRDLTVVGVHLPSRLYLPSEEDQRLAAEWCRLFVEDRERPTAEGGVGHDRTVVIGDFNLDPHSPAMVGFAGFNAMMTARAAGRPRRLRGRTCATFYNPMWNTLGDASGSPGTYYLRAPGTLGYYWHVLDQVLLRGSIVPHFEGVCVLDDERLVSPRARTPSMSDHLPIELILSASLFQRELVSRPGNRAEE